MDLEGEYLIQEQIALEEVGVWHKITPFLYGIGMIKAVPL